MYRVFVAVMLWLFVAGCSKIVPGQQESGVPISVVPVVQQVKSGATKALINGAAELQQYPISLLGTAEFGNSVSAVFGNDVLSYNTTVSKWSYGNNPKYWIPGAFYSFVAFCPYADVDSDGIVKPEKSLSNGEVSLRNNVLSIKNYITGKGVGFDARSEDLLYSVVERDNTKEDDYSPVQLQMEHLLACLEFNVRNATNVDIVKVYDIALVGLKYKCTSVELSGAVGAVLVDEQSTVISSESYFSANNIGNGTDAVLPKGMSQEDFKHLYDCENITVIPQDVWETGISLTFNVQFRNSSVVSYSVDLGEVESVIRWDKGKKYKYNLTISSKDIYFQVSEVPWKTHEVEL